MQARAQQIISDVFSQSKNVMAEVAFLHQQLQQSSDKIERITDKNRSLQMQLEISDCRCKELLVEGRAMQALIDQQGKRIEDFIHGMKKLSSSTSSAAVQDGIIQQLRKEIGEKDDCIEKLRAKFNRELLGWGGGGSSAPVASRSRAMGVSSEDKAAAQKHQPPLESSSLGRGKDALEQLEFLAKVFEQELGIAESASSHRAASFGQTNSPRPRPSPIMKPEQLQAMLSVEQQVPPPINTSNHGTSPAFRPLFLARRLRPSTPPPPPPLPSSLALQPLEVAPPVVRDLKTMASF